MKDLGLGVDLSPSVQQQPDHDHVSTSGSDVQRCDAILLGGEGSSPYISGQLRVRAGSKRPPRRVAAPYLWREVDIGASVEQQLSHIQVFIVCSDV